MPRTENKLCQLIRQVTELAPLADALDDLEARIEQMLAMTKDLELGLG